MVQAPEVQRQIDQSSQRIRAAAGKGIEQAHLDIRMRCQTLQEAVHAVGVEVVDQQAHPHTALRGITQPGMPEGSNPWFQMVNRGKRSMAIDLRRRAGRELFDRLLSESDVLIVNLQSSAAQKLGVDAETVRAWEREEEFPTKALCEAMEGSL